MKNSELVGLVVDILTHGMPFVYKDPDFGHFPISKIDWATKTAEYFVDFDHFNNCELEDTSNIGYRTVDIDVLISSIKEGVYGFEDGGDMDDNWIIDYDPEDDEDDEEE